MRPADRRATAQGYRVHQQAPGAPLTTCGRRVRARYATPDWAQVTCQPCQALRRAPATDFGRAVREGLRAAGKLP